MKNKESKFKVGDIIARSSNPSEMRLIFLVASEFYYFIDIKEGYGELFFNPTKSAYRIVNMDTCFSKVGEIKDLSKLQEDMRKINIEFNCAFIFADDLFQKGEGWLTRYNGEFKTL